MAAMTIPKMARLMVQASNGAAAKPSISPLLAHCMYHGATECAWFIKENHERNMYAALRQIVRGLKAVQSEWRVGGRSEERRVGKGCVRTCRSGGWPTHEK